MSNNIKIVMPENFSVEEAAEFRSEMSNCINKGECNFIFDFNNCKFIDSTGLGVIVAVYKRCAEYGGSLKLKSLNPSVRKVFMLTRFDKVFEILE